MQRMRLENILFEKEGIRMRDIYKNHKTLKGRCVMSKLIVKKGNTFIQDLPIYDRNGQLVQNLSASGIEIVFEVKKNKTDAPAAALIHKDLLKETIRDRNICIF